MRKVFIGYNRVSTKGQGESGLGLEAQTTATEAFVASHGADAKLLAAYTEVESGKHADRPELAKASTVSAATPISSSACRKPAFVSRPSTCRTPIISPWGSWP